MKVFLGPAGIGTGEELKKYKEFGLNAAEVAFTYRVYLTNKEAIKIGELASNLKIKLSIHAPYYINLNSKDEIKIKQSKKRILDSCERGHYLKAKYIVFHPGFYSQFTEKETYENIKKEILDLQETIKKNKWDVKLAPETTGKKNVFGSLDEILKLVRETKCHFCVDFAHLLARNNGKIDYKEIFKKLKNFNFIHSHFSGIEYTDKGERNHKITPLSEIKKLAKEVLKNKRDITIINESPMTVTDSIKTKKVFENLGYKLRL